MAPNVGHCSPDRGQTLAEQQQISRSNSTLNMFLGGSRIPQWMTGSVPQGIRSPPKTTSTQRPTLGLRKRSLGANQTEAIPASQPSQQGTSVTENSKTASSNPQATFASSEVVLAECRWRDKSAGTQSTVLPSPAPSDETTSPAVTTAHNSPIPMADALVTEATPIGAWAQNDAEQQPGSVSAGARHWGLAIATGPAQTSPNWNGTRAREMTRGEDLERMKRRRIAACQSTSSVPGATIDRGILDAWLGELDRYMANATNDHPVARRRLKTLWNALEQGDSFFVALHQVFMLWWSKPEGAKCVMEAFLSGDVVDEGCKILTNILKRNEGFDVAAILWLADFPVPLLERDGTACTALRESAILRDRVGAVGNFLRRLAADWHHLIGVGPERGYPLRAKELIEALDLTSPILLQILFTYSRRSLGITDTPAIWPMIENLYKLFKHEQQVCLNQNISHGQKLALETKFISLYRQYSSAALDQLRVQGNQASGHGQSRSGETLDQLPLHVQQPQQQFQGQVNMQMPLQHTLQAHPLPSLRPVASSQQRQHYLPMTGASGELTSQLHHRTAQQQQPGTVPLPAMSPAIASPAGSASLSQPAHFSPSTANTTLPNGSFATGGFGSYQDGPGLSGFSTPLGTQFGNFNAPPSFGEVSQLPISMPPMQSPIMSLNSPNMMLQHQLSLQQQTHPRPQPQSQLYPQRRGSLPMPQGHLMAQQVSLEQRGGRAQPVQQLQQIPSPCVSVFATHQQPWQQQQQPGQPCQLGQQPGQQVNQRLQIPRQPSQPSTLGRNYQAPGLQQRLLPETGRLIPEHEYPWEDMSAAAASLHMVDVLSPPRYLCNRAQPAELQVAPHETYFQFVSKVVVGPVRHSYKILDKLEFEVSQATFDKLAKPLTPPGRGYNMCPYSAGTLRYRFRVCEVAERDIIEGAPTLSGWITSTTMWPEAITVQLNKDSFPKLPRKENWRKAKPAELTTHVVPGVNVLSAAIFNKPKAGHAFFGAVEEINTLKRSEILDFVWNYRALEPHLTLAVIKDRLQPSNFDSDDVQPEDEMAISLSDPFSASLCKTPVRGERCRHLDVFDLETWLQTRPAKRRCFHQVQEASSCGRCDKHGPMWQEPSQVDVWKCPICSVDARPNSLWHDLFLQSVCDELSKQGKGNVKSIYVKTDGTWRSKDDGVESNDDEESEDEGPQKIKPPAQPLSSLSSTASLLTSTTVRSRPQPAVIVLDD